MMVFLLLLLIIIIKMGRGGRRRRKEWMPEKWEMCPDDQRRGYNNGGACGG